MKTHTKVAESIRQTIESLIMCDWRHVDLDDLRQATAKLRSIKAQYVVSHRMIDQLQADLISTLDQALVEFYLAQDALEGRDLQQRRDIYGALRNAQVPLFSTYAALQPLLSSQEIGSLSTEQQETQEHKESPMIVQRFGWTSEKQQQLCEEFLQSQQATVKAICEEISSRHGWPMGSVTAKAYELRLPQQQRQAREARSASPSEQEGD